MIKVAILDDYQQVAQSIGDWSNLTSRCAVTSFSAPIRSVEDASEKLRDFTVICAMRERMPFPAELLRRLPNLRLLCTTGIRNSSIDVDAATAQGILVCHTRSADSEYATSELTWALILASIRHLPLEDRRMRAGEWQTTIGRTLHGKTLGLLGLGRVGSRVGRIGSAFGMKVIAWSPNLTPERAQEENATCVEKHELFESSDIVSLHLILSSRTADVVGAAELALMQPHAFIVNTSRGPLIDEKALIEALEERRIAGAGLDVFHEEPIRADHPFLRQDRVVLSPHIGYVTGETYRIFFEDTIENIDAFLSGQPIRLLNPDAQQRSA